MIRTLEKYELLEEIGHGGMATVFRARDTNLDRLVALKLMHPHLRGAKEARARFRREAQSVARLKHPCILEIYDYSGEGSDESYISAELLTGPTLKVFVEQAIELPAEIAACFGIEIARALVAAHEKGIIHRDVKPENILLHDNRCLKLTDFGIADMVDSQSMTATGQILGSPGHMAPEQIEGQHTDARTDVFALGTVLYFLAVGRLPFTGKNPHQILKRILDGDVPDPLRFRPAVGGRFKAILLKAMAKSAADRYQSAAELEAALRAYVAPVGIEDPGREVARFLADPTSVRDEVNARIVSAEIAHGKRAQAEDRKADANDAFARALAIDEKNAEVLSLVSSLGRAAERERTQKRFGLAALGLGALGLFGWAAFSLVGGPDEPIGPEPLVTLDAALPDAALPRDAGSDAPAASDDAATDDAFDDPDAFAPLAIEPHVIRRDPSLPAIPRRVIFDPDPANVLISVDGAEPRNYGSFNSIELVPGRHSFRFVSNVACCADATIERDIPAGAGDFRLSQVLPSRPALLLVRTNVPADVVVEGGPQGRARRPITVPIRARERSELRTITVTAPGYRAYTGDVQLTAGETPEVQVTLEPDPSAPAPEGGPPGGAGE
ncbi:MAG: serine/threonine-protein kinase [Sandaracinus sp.]